MGLDVFHLPHWCTLDIFASLSTSPPSHPPSAIVHCSVPRATLKGSPSTEGCCKGSLGGPRQQTLPWICLCEMQARPQPCCGTDKKPNASQGTPPVSPRSHGCSHPCPHKVLTLHLSDAMLLSVLVFTPLISTQTECNTCQGCILGSHSCHFIRSPFDSILSFIWWNVSRGPNCLHVTNTVYFPYSDCFRRE